MRPTFRDIISGINDTIWTTVVFMQVEVALIQNMNMMQSLETGL